MSFRSLERFILVVLFHISLVHFSVSIFLSSALRLPRAGFSLRGTRKENVRKENAFVIFLSFIFLSSIFSSIFLSSNRLRFRLTARPYGAEGLG